MLLLFVILPITYAKRVHDVAVTDLKVWPTSAYPGLTIDIDVTIENQGDFPETFDVLVYAVRLTDGLRIDIGSETVSLNVGASETLYFIWDTTGVPPGSYWVIAEAVLPDDADPKDNIRRVLVGGIYPRRSGYDTNIFELLASVALIVILMVSLGMAPIVIFEILMSPKLRWPWPLSKRRKCNATK